MISFSQNTIIAVILLCVISRSSIAQELTLFESIESETPQSKVNTQGNSQILANNIDPAFTLVGTVRISGSRRVHLSHRSGEIVSVAFTESNAVQIPGYEEYILLRVRGSQITLRYPANEPCISLEDKGIRCESDSIANLTLSIRKALVEQQSTQPSEQEVVEESPDNPFARIRAANAADNPASDPNSQRFRPRRISPEDVPEGMRVISTPFGDRLVQE